MESITDDFQPFPSMQKKYASTVYHQREKNKQQFIQVKLTESNYLPQNVRERREGGNTRRPAGAGKRRTNAQKAIRVQQETDKREYLAKCQRARYYNMHDIKILNQSLRFSEVF